MIERPELRDSRTAGSYRSHSFFVRVASWFDLEPADDDPLPSAVAVLAHEFAHYLHNVSTCSGLYLFIANLWLMRSVVGGADRKGHFTGERGLAEPQLHVVKSARALQRALVGGSNWEGGLEPPEKVTAWEFGPVHRRAISFDFTPPLTVETVSLDLVLTNEAGSSVSGCLDIGHHFITEGVAYEVDRECRRVAGVQWFLLDEGVSAYPYLAFRQLIECWAGRETTALERIHLGVCAMLTPSPAAALLDLCTRLRCLAGPPCATGLPAPVIDDVLSVFQRDAMKLIDEVLQPELEAVSPHGRVHDGAELALALFRAGFALRTINPFLETFLVDETASRDALYDRIASLVDCCVLQEKPGGQVVMRWIGPGVVPFDEEEATSLAIFQSAMHFAQSHFGKEELVATAGLGEVRCPYDGACSRQQQDGMPETCRKRPWTRFADARGEETVCWYAAGVRALARL